MEYKEYFVDATMTWYGSETHANPTFTIRYGGDVVHESVVYAKFEDDASAEDAAYQAAREWIDAKCRSIDGKVVEYVPKALETQAHLRCKD